MQLILNDKLIANGLDIFTTEKDEVILQFTIKEKAEPINIILTRINAKATLITLDEILRRNHA